jgi:hypothetical protein
VSPKKTAKRQIADEETIPAVLKLLPAPTPTLFTLEEDEDGVSDEECLVEAELFGIQIEEKLMEIPTLKKKSSCQSVSWRDRSDKNENGCEANNINPQCITYAADLCVNTCSKPSKTPK